MVTNIKSKITEAEFSRLSEELVPIYLELLGFVTDERNAELRREEAAAFARAGITPEEYESELIARVE